MLTANFEDRDLVVDILSKSFNDNLSVNYVIKQDRHREQRVKKLMAYSFNMCKRFGRVVLSENRKACALIMFPDKKRTTLQSILWDLELIRGCIGLGGISKATRREHRIKTLQPKDALYYLWFIGVQPGEQGMGHGTSLLADMISDGPARAALVFAANKVRRSKQNNGALGNAKK
jgi:ribosomal protein S18 acetylase RimI-like enzyme